MSQALTNAIVFLIKTLFNLYLYVLIIRLLLQWFNARYHNPFSQFIVKLTQPLIKPLRRFLRVFHSVDTAVLFWLFIVSILKLYLVFVIQGQGIANFFAVLILACADIIWHLLNVLFFVVLAGAIISWIRPSQYSPLIEVVEVITEPILAPARRIIPPIAGFDLSPIVVLVLLQLLIILVVSPLQSFGVRLI